MLFGRDNDQLSRNPTVFQWCDNVNNYSNS